MSQSADHSPALFPGYDPRTMAPADRCLAQALINLKTVKGDLDAAAEQASASPRDLRLILGTYGARAIAAAHAGELAVIAVNRNIASLTYRARAGDEGAKAVRRLPDVARRAREAEVMARRLAARDIVNVRLADLPPDARDLTAAILGDPPAGRVAAERASYRRRQPSLPRPPWSEPIEDTGAIPSAAQ